jgi:hypothetical protein
MRVGGGFLLDVEFGDKGGEFADLLAVSDEIGFGRSVRLGKFVELDLGGGEFLRRKGEGEQSKGRW